MEFLEYGKTSFIGILSKILNIRRILVIDFDIEGNNLQNVYGNFETAKESKRKLKKQENIFEEFLAKVSDNIDLVSNLEWVFSKEKVSNLDEVKNMLEYEKRKYDIILIDTSDNQEYREITEKILDLSTKIICLSEGNLLSIKKTKRLLEKFNFEKEKIYIIYNKQNQYSLEIAMFEMMFFNYKLLGIISYDCKFEQIINKNLNLAFITKNIRYEFEKIIKRLNIK